MALHRKIIWSPSAKQDLENITDYLMHEWGNRIVLKFLKKLDWILSQIEINPKQYPLIHSKFKLRRCVLTKQNALYYRIKKGDIEIVRIFDTRQDPERLKILF